MMMRMRMGCRGGEGQGSCEEERRGEEQGRQLHRLFLLLACYMLIIDQSLQGVVSCFHYETKGICLKALIDGIETEGMLC